MPQDTGYGMADYFGDIGAIGQDQRNAAQIEWIAAINGQTPEEFIATQAQLQADQAAASDSQTAYNQWLAGGYNGTNVPKTMFETEQLGDQWNTTLGQQTASTNATLGGLSNQAATIYPGLAQQAQWLGAQNAGLAQQSWDSTNWANQQDQVALGNYGTAVGNAGAWDLANFQNLANAANAPMQMSASPYVGDAQSNPADVARQMQVYGQLQGVAGGSLDQISQAAQAYANAQDVANQQAAAGQLQAAGNGALDVDLRSIRELDKLRDPDQIGGMRDLYDASNGSKDVHVGQEDPEAYAAAVDARNKLKDLTGLEVTSQERLMYELSRQQQEQDELGVRMALAADSRQRGVGGAGTEIARTALAQQQTSRNRMLQDMAANANAQQRQMQAIQGYGTISTNMTAQANQLAMQNQAQQMAALGQYTDVHANSANVLGQIGAANATNNANRRLAGQQAAYQAYAELRAQGFSEEYARGVAADNMANANADRRLGGMVASGNMANTMRSQGDAMNMFNQNQQQLQQQFSDSYTANRQDAQFGRQATVFDAGNTVGRNYMTDQGNLFNANTGVTAANNQRVQGSIATQSGLAGQWVGATQGAAGIGLQGIATQGGLAQQQLGNTANQADREVNWGTQKTANAMDLRNIGEGNRADSAARREAANAADREVISSWGSTKADVEAAKARIAARNAGA